jgi:hypothetical protein
MNKLVFALLVGLVFTACQNTPKVESESTTPASTAAPTAPEAPTAPTMEVIQQASVTVSTGLKRMEDLRKQIDALPDKVKKEKATEIEGMYATLEGMIAKQTKMMKDIQVANTTPNGKEGQFKETDSPETLTTALLQDYTESVARYSKEAQAIEEALGKMKK